MNAKQRPNVGIMSDIKLASGNGMSDQMNDQVPGQLAKLREPFPPEAISKLPKPFKKDSPKGNCKECGGYHGLPAAHLDYVGHAALTDRLLSVDPFWQWEPLAFDDQGLPRFDAAGGLWIKLTVCGVTRLGYGQAEYKAYMDLGSREKEVIGDALRNAGMRFGCALDLWHKGDMLPGSAHESTEYTNEQKVEFDALLASSDALGMTAFMASLPDDVQIALFNSFEKGLKSSGKAAARELTAQGTVKWKEIIEYLEELIAKDDPHGVLQVVEDMSHGNKKHLSKLLGEERSKIIGAMIRSIDAKNPD